MKLKYVLLFVLISVSFFYIDNVNAEVLHYDFEQNYCDNNNSNCFSENGTVSYTDDVNYVTNGDYALYLNNPSKTKSPNALYMLIDEVFDSPEYISIEFDWYRASNAVTYSKLFTYWYSSSGSYTQEVKASGTCSWFMSDTCFEPDTINHVKITKDGSTVTVVNTTVSGNTYTATVTKDAFYRFDLGWNNGDDSSFTGYIDNMYIMTSADDTIENVPTISITEDSKTSVTILDKEYITDVTLNIEFSLIDNEKYLYMYKYGIDSEWATMTLTQSNNFSKTYSTNDTLYVQVIDRKTHDVLATSTFTISSINNIPNDDKVTIYFQKITDDVDSTLYNQCTIKQGLVSYRACETFSISFDIINYNKYIYEMSLDGGVTWVDVSTRLYNNFFLERIFENKTIYIRVLNRSDYSLNNASTFTVSSIESTSELGQKVLFGSSYSVQSPDIDVTALFINYDSSNYNYYYSLYNTSDSFIDITDSIDCTNNLCTFKTRIYVKGTMYVRIEDKTGNLIYTATYTVDYYNWINSNNPFDKDDFFSTFFDSFDYFLNPIKEIFNSITLFFDSLPIEIKYIFYVSFVIIIILFLIKFIL